jgi:hypothetical protein
MSRSIHITSKNFRGLTKREVDEQYFDPNSELNQWAEKLHIKKSVVKSRKQTKILKKDTENNIQH